jgi:hypothetical protein
MFAIGSASRAILAVGVNGSAELSTNYARQSINNVDNQTKFWFWDKRREDWLVLVVLIDCLLRRGVTIRNTRSNTGARNRGHESSPVNNASTITRAITMLPLH